MAVCSTIVVAELSGTEVMQRIQDQANYHHTKTSVVSMQIVNKKKKKRYRVFKSFSKYKPEVAQNRSLLKFYEPANVSGVALLSIRDDQKSTNTNTTNQWVYFPAFKSIKQIVGSQKNDSFMGSDFTYDDMSGRAISRDTHTILKTDASHTVGDCCETGDLN